MKKIISMLLTFCMCISLFACASSNTAKTSESQEIKKTGGSLKIVATSESYKDLFARFESETGIKGEILSMSSGEVLSKLRAEGGTPSADVWFGGGIDAFIAAKNDGLLEKVDFEASKLLAPEYKDKDNYYFSKGITVVGFLFNNDFVDCFKVVISVLLVGL